MNLIKSIGDCNLISVITSAIFGISLSHTGGHVTAGRHHCENL
jgi:hypothetical protein